MGRSLIICAAAGLLLFPFAAFAADSGTREAQTYDVPPVAQALVREGDFAVKLAARYGLGAPANETEAEDLLSSAGVVPLNGWISDYPVTPDILGQLQEAAARAASEGRLSMTAERASQLLYDLASELQLPVPAGAGTRAAVEPRAPEQQQIVDNYYTGYGPPIITYYPPPPAYLYLYAWVPYPAWWYGYWYPGFYICNNFTTTIVVDSRRVYVRNRFVDPVSRRVVRVDPVMRGDGGAVRPLTILRTDDGRTYRNIRDMRRGIVSGDVEQGRGGTPSVRPPGAGGFRSSDDRRSARDIYRGNIERQGAVSQGGQSRSGVIRNDERRTGRQGAVGGSSAVVPPRSGQRSQDRRLGDVERNLGTSGRSTGSYDLPSRRGSGQQFRDSTSPRSFAAPAPGQLAPPSTPRPSRQKADDGEERPGRRNR